MTILEACVTVLRDCSAPLSAEEIFEGISRRGLYEFGAKRPIEMVRGTIRKHLRLPANQRLVVEIGKGQFAAAAAPK